MSHSTTGHVIYYVSGIDRSGARVLISPADDAQEAHCIAGNAECSGEYAAVQVEEDVLPDVVGVGALWDVA